MSCLASSHIAGLARDRKVAVLGFGISNRPLARLLLSLGAKVTVYDKRPAAELGPEANELAAGGVDFTADMEQALAGPPALIFRTPGIRPDHPAIAAAVAKGAVLTSEMAWFLEATPAHLVAISGSDGKTTTATLTAKLLEAAGHRVYLGGNIGRPLLPLVDEMTAKDFAVVELSSFQLCDLPPSAVPHRAVLTNLTPNHLNWHTDLAEYAAAKARIYGGPRCERLVVNGGDPTTRAMGRAAKTTRRDVIMFSARQALLGQSAEVIALVDGAICRRSPEGRVTPLLSVADIALPGLHNIENYMAALGLVHDLVTPAAIRQVATTFRGVDHRLQPVRLRRGVTYYNSSIDSTPARTAAALSALDCPIVIICGGADKNTDYAPLARDLCARVRAVVLTGQTGPKIFAALQACPDFDPDRLTVCREPDFEQAVKAAAALARPGEAVLLSPASTSFDAFPNFEVRGQTFARIVSELPD